MVRILARIILSILANAIGLAAAAALLDGFTINGVSFVTAVIIFSLSTAILGPLVLSIALKGASYLVGGIALITTLLGLIVTNVVSDSLSVHGLSTWIIATLIIWIFSIIGSLLLPLVLFKKTLKKAKSEQ